MSLLRHTVRARLKGNRTLTGTIHIAEGEALSEFLSSKRSFLNLTQVHWQDSPDEGALPHLSVRLGQITWVEPRDPELRLSTAVVPAEESRKVELLVDEGLRLQVHLNVAPETRMSDYLEARASFVPLWSVQVEGQSGAIERVALNHGAIHVVRELDETDPRRGR